MQYQSDRREMKSTGLGNSIFPVYVQYVSCQSLLQSTEVSNKFIQTLRITLLIVQSKCLQRSSKTDTKSCLECNVEMDFDYKKKHNLKFHLNLLRQRKFIVIM